MVGAERCPDGRLLVQWSTHLRWHARSDLAAVPSPAVKETR